MRKRKLPPGSASPPTQYTVAANIPLVPVGTNQQYRYLMLAWTGTNHRQTAGALIGDLEIAAVKEKTLVPSFLRQLPSAHCTLARANRYRCRRGVARCARISCLAPARRRTRSPGPSPAGRALAPADR